MSLFRKKQQGTVSLDNGQPIIFAGPPVPQDMPPAEPSMNPPTDEQIRDYLNRNPDALGEFVNRDMRIRPDWWRAYFLKRARIAGSANRHALRGDR